MEEGKEGGERLQTGKLNIHQIETLKKDLLAFKQQLLHMKVSVFAENQSKEISIRYLHRQL